MSVSLLSISPLRRLLERLDMRSEQQATCLAVGFLAKFLLEKHGRLALDTHFRRTLPPVELGQYALFVDQIGRTIGMLTWASVDEARLQKLRSTGIDSLEPHEWHSGPHVWIAEFCAFAGAGGAMARLLRRTTFSASASVSYARERRGGRRSFRWKNRPAAEGAAPFVPGDRLAHANPDVLHGRKATLEATVRIGEFFLALQYSNVHRSQPFALANYAVRQFIALRQYAIIRAPGDEIAGVVTWTWLSPYTLDNLGRLPLHDCHVSEWNEGLSLCISDVSCSRPGQEHVLEFIEKQRLASERKLLLYARPHKGSPAQCMEIAAEGDYRGKLKSALSAIFFDR